jgi:NADH:ubiquinone oxidoreductase subunit F (NADH-binding)
MGFIRGDIFPRNTSGKIDPAGDFDELDCKLDFDDPRHYNLLGLGTAAAVVVAEDTDIRDVLVNITRFFSHESCGQCTQCREGTGWMYKISKRIRSGAGRIADIDILDEVSRNMGMMPGLSICGLPDGAAFPVRTLVRKFRKELEEGIRAQEPNAVLNYVRKINPAVYELPVVGAAPGTLQNRGTMSYEYFAAKGSRT